MRSNIVGYHGSKPLGLWLYGLFLPRTPSHGGAVRLAGLGVYVDRLKAVACYLKSAETGCAEAQNNLYSLSTLIVPKTSVQAEYLLSSAEYCQAP